MGGGDIPQVMAQLLWCLPQPKSKWDEYIFTKGCIQALEGWLPRNIYIVAGIFIAISLLQVCSHCPRGSLSPCGCTCSFGPDFTGGELVVAQGQ